MSGLTAILVVTGLMAMSQQLIRMIIVVTENGGKTMKKPNAYLARQEEKRIERETMILAWGVQIAFDAIEFTLNDPEAMGKDVFGEKRIEKICPYLNKYAREVMRGLIQTDPAASHIRRVVDERKQQISKSLFVPWEERYIGWDDRGI